MTIETVSNLESVSCLEILFEKFWEEIEEITIFQSANFKVRRSRLYSDNSLIIK